jgi:hypothetical protein
MKKIYLVTVLVVLSALFFACGGSQVPAEETREGEGDAVEAVITNGLGDWNIAEIWIDASDGAWSENRITEPLEPGDDFTVVLDEAGTYDIMIIDEDGDSYTVWGVEIDETGYSWEVTLDDLDTGSEGDVEVTIENGLGSYDLWYGYCSSTSADSWGEDRFGSEIIAPGESMSFSVASGDSYDFMVEDADGDTYVLYDQPIDADGFVWEVQLSDMDNTASVAAEGDAPITITNGLGDWAIWYVYGDPSDSGWGDDRLGSDVLEPGEEFTFYVPAGDTYDFKVEDEDGDVYSIWGIEVDESGFNWEVTLSDLD